MLYINIKKVKPYKEIIENKEPEPKALDLMFISELKKKIKIEIGYKNSHD